MKPVSRFIVEKEVHGEYLRAWAENEGMEFEMRPLSVNESRANLNDRIRFVGYFSKTPGLVAKAIHADTHMKDDFEYRVGELLGYPDCCNLAWSRAGFIPKESDRVSFFFDRYLPGAEPENNPFLNFTQKSLSFFYPCTLACRHALAVHEKQADVIRADAPEFYAEIVRVRSMPILFLGPKQSKTLSINLHFDEIFRTHFVGKKISPNVIVYADFFLSSLSFLDQVSEPAYADSCVRFVRALLSGDNVVADDSGAVSVRKGKTVVDRFENDFSRSAILSEGRA